MYKMVGSRNLKISIGEIIKDPEILRLVPDHLKTKMMCRHAVKKLLFLVKFFPDRYKTQGTRDKVILENGGMLMFILDPYKDQNMCNKAVDNYAHALGSVPNYHTTQKNV